ncbi:MAG: hypothetical protein ACOVNQ_01870 [Pirellula sp.]
MTKHDVWDSLMGLTVHSITASKFKLIRFSFTVLAAIFMLEVAALAQNQANSSDNGLGLGGRKLADGVLTIIPSDQNAEDTALGPFDLDFVAKHPELNWTAPDFPNNQPNFASPAETLLAQSKNVTFRHPVWGLEFAFKPMRLIEVDIPNATGVMEKKTVWYLVYRIRYTGNDLQPAIKDLSDSEAVPGEPKKVRYDSVRFIPRFTLLSKERQLAMDSQILMPAVQAIAARERVPGGRLADHIEIARQEVPVSKGPEDGFWGVATWTDVDPRLDFFAIDVRGLTNAYQIQVDSGNDKKYLRRTLRIYFWRPGDALDVARDRIYLGPPAYEDPARVNYYLQQFGLKERLDYQWIYR